MSWKFDIDLPMPFEMRLNAHEYASRATMPVVRSSDEAWEAFARADEEFRAALESARHQLANTLRANCFGKCVEGESMFAAVRRVLSDAGAPSLATRLENQEEYLTAHASVCRGASSQIGSADQL